MADSSVADLGLRAWRYTLARLAGASALLAALVAPPAVAADWPMFGQNIGNTASLVDNVDTDLSQLKVKWVFTTGGDVSARAAVVKGVAYFPDWGGNLWAVNTTTGAKVWGHQLSDYGFQVPTHSRTSPAVVDGVVYVGTQEGAWLLAIKASDGSLLWKTQLESPANDTYAMVTASPVVYAGMVYTGVASNEEGLAGFGISCCKARGSVVGVNASTGAIVWKTYTIPQGYSGGGVWGSNFVVHPARNALYVGTGNNYSHPKDPAYVDCIAGGGTATTCASPDNHVDSILSIDLTTGAIQWAHKFVTWNQPGFATDGSDDWNVSCFIPPFNNCPSSPGPDYDFASAPNLITYTKNGVQKTILGAGQKSGIYYALDPATGGELWRTQVGPGSSLGGMEWGSATDGTRIYVAIANFYGIPTNVGNGGSWSALDPDTGAILWQVGDPNGAVDIGPMTVANGVVFVSSMGGASNAATMLGLNAATGQTVWSYAAGVSVNAGATVAGNSIYWGSGYAHLGIAGYTGYSPPTGPSSAGKFFAFSKQGK